MEPALVLGGAPAPVVDEEQVDRGAGEGVEGVGGAVLGDAGGQAAQVLQAADDERAAEVALAEGFGVECAQAGVAGGRGGEHGLQPGGLAFEVIETATQAGRTIAHVRMRATQTGPFVVFPDGGHPIAFPPTGRAFAVRHCHVFRLRDGRHAEHIAVRDDLAMMTQLGHLPPGPGVLARMAGWQLTGSARRAVRQAVTVAHNAAAADQDPAAAARGAHRP